MTRSLPIVLEFKVDTNQIWALRKYRSLQIYNATFPSVPLSKMFTSNPFYFLGLIHLEVRHNDVADTHAALDYMLEVGARRIACPWKACCCAKKSQALKAACGVSGGLLC